MHLTFMHSQQIHIIIAHLLHSYHFIKTYFQLWTNFILNTISELTNVPIYHSIIQFQLFELQASDN